MVQSLKNRIDDLKSNQENNKVIDNETPEKQEDVFIKNYEYDNDDQKKENEENPIKKEEKNEILTQQSHQSKSS